MAIWGLSLIGFFCIYNKIRLAIAIIKTAAIFIRDTFSIILVPPVISIGTGALWAGWIYTAIYLYSCNAVSGSGDLPFATVTWTGYNKQLFWYWIFAGLWINAFLQALCIFIVASACCIWYFSQGSG